MSSNNHHLLVTAIILEYLLSVSVNQRQIQLKRENVSFLKLYLIFYYPVLQVKPSH